MENTDAEVIDLPETPARFQNVYPVLVCPGAQLVIAEDITVVEIADRINEAAVAGHALVTFDTFVHDPYLSDDPVSEPSPVAIDEIKIITTMRHQSNTITQQSGLILPTPEQSIQVGHQPQRPQG